MITQQQALAIVNELDGICGDISPECKLLRQYIEQGAQPGADVVRARTRVTPAMQEAGEAALSRFYKRTNGDGTYQELVLCVLRAALSAAPQPQQEQSKR